MDAAANRESTAKRTVARWVCLAAVILVAFFLLVSLSGCKKSLILTDLVVDQENGEIDQSAEPLYKETPGAPEDPTRVSTLKSKKKEEKEKKEKPQYDKKKVTSQKYTENWEHKEESTHEDNASTGDSEGESQEEKGKTGTEGTDEAGEEDGGESSASETGGKGGEGTTYDASGKQAKLPENVHTVAATGQYALITQMLAGKGALVAADKDWLTSTIESGAFAGEGLKDVAVAWSGDGTKEGSCDYSTLRDLNPDCLLIESTEKCGLTEEQIAKLKSDGVNVVLMPSLNTVDTPDDNIVQAVQLVGELLKSAGSTIQYDASAMADTYVSMHNDAINSCVNANGGYSYKTNNGVTYGFIYQGTSDTGKATTSLSTTRITTAFIDSWMSLSMSTVSSGRRYGNVSMSYLPGASVKLDCSEGLGLSAQTTGKNFVLLDYYLQCSGVIDNSFEKAKPTAYSGTLGESKPCAIAAGGTDGLKIDDVVTKRVVPSALWYSQTGDMASSSSWLTVGDADFPGIIVRSKAISKKVVDSASKTKGFYNVGQPYYVYTVPTGLAGNWADGNVESYLMAPWTYGCFRSGNDLSTCSTYVSSFYGTFYRADASKLLSNYTDGIAIAECPTAGSDSED